MWENFLGGDFDLFNLRKFTVEKCSWNAMSVRKISERVYTLFNISKFMWRKPR